MGCDTAVRVEDGDLESRLHVRTIMGRKKSSVIIKRDQNSPKFAVLRIDKIPDLVVEKV
jgi:hypothetical protein